jgi:hypothetical protein
LSGRISLLFKIAILNKSEIPPDKRQAKFDLGVAVTVDIALKPGMLLVSFDHVSIPRKIIIIMIFNIFYKITIA